MAKYETVLDRLSHWAKVHPDKDVWTFMDDKGVVSDSYTYCQLEESTTALSNYLLQKTKLRAGSRVLLVFFPGLDFTASLLACFKAGIIAVPVFPPDPRRLKKDLHHFISIQSNSGAVDVLTHGSYNFSKKISSLKSMFVGGDATWPELNWIQVDDILGRSKFKGSKPSLQTNYAFSKSDYYKDVAFLQYTSGSTSEPKGVMITHESLSHNITIILRELKADVATVNVSWLPQYHDMGLIGSYMGLLYCGGTGYYLSPISFLKDPTIWIRTMSKYKATHTQAPNFAYALAVRKHNDAKPFVGSLNLSSLQHMINAAEPVEFLSIQRFYETFGPFGLPVGVVVPTYGLAEHTVFVCSGGRQVVRVSKAALESGQVELLECRELSDVLTVPFQVDAEDDGKQKSKSQIIVGCGFPAQGEHVDLRIVDPESSKAQADLRVGEIWVTSPSKSIGYWGHSVENNRADFHAIISAEGEMAESSSADGYLRTGDLGFTVNGELFVCGRLKDLIIVRGSNHYPQDIERTAEAAAAAHLRPGCSAAFSVAPRSDSDSEAVVYVAELKESVPVAHHGKVCDAIKTAVAAEHGVALATILLLVTRSVPKTTSGKIARSWCKRAYLNNTLSVAYRWEGSGEADLSLVDSTNNNNENDIPSGAAMEQQPAESVGSLERLTESQVRALSVTEAAALLETTLLRVAATGSAGLTGPLDHHVALVTLGLDSMTLVQFKGVLENRLYCDVPDDFLFATSCTLEALGEAVRHGSLTEEQKALLESAASAAAGGAAAAGKASGMNPEEQAASVVVVNHSEPCCPWFYCCY